MEITAKLKERFCKDMNIPIKLFEEPYFQSRLELYDNQYDTLEKYEMFKTLVTKFDNEQDYFSEYNKLKDNIIEFLGNTEGMKRLKEDDMNKYALKNPGFTSKDIFKGNFIGRYFISIDMRKANYSALRHYDRGIVGNTDTYEDFIGLFTEEDYFKCSKYIRQVVFGHHNPKRQTIYEKHLMDMFLTDLLQFTDNKDIVSFSNDEIVIDITEQADIERYTEGIDLLISIYKDKKILLRQDYFKLEKIENTSGYIRKFINKEGYDFKCVDALSMPFILRAYNNEEVQEIDKVFVYEGYFSKLIDIPVIEKV